MMKNNSSIKCKQEALWTSRTLANVFHENVSSLSWQNGETTTRYSFICHDTKTLQLGIKSDFVSLD